MNETSELAMFAALRYGAEKLNGSLLPIVAGLERYLLRNVNGLSLRSAQMPIFRHDESDSPHADPGSRSAKGGSCEYHRAGIS